MDSQTYRLGRIASACLLSLASGAALAQEPNPYYVGASQEFVHDSNFFRAAPGQTATSQTISSTSLLAGLDQPIGRHRLFADAALRSVRHDGNGQLDYSGNSLLAGADWSAIDVLSGRLSYGTDRKLARYGVDYGFLDPNTRVLQTSKELIFKAQYGQASVLAVEGGYTRQEIDFSVQSSNQFEQDIYSVGVRLWPSGPLTVGIGARRTDGGYPFATLGGGVIGADNYQRDDIDLLATWAATGASTVTARLSHTKEDHDALPERNVSGATGAVAWKYQPTGKLKLGLDWIRDTGASSSFNPGAAGGVAPIVNSAPLTTTWQLQADYEVLAKVQLQALARQYKRHLVNTAGEAGNDKLVETSLGLTWAPLRSVQVGCSVGREKRDTDGSGLSVAYSATVSRCLAQLKLQ